MDNYTEIENKLFDYIIELSEGKKSKEQFENYKKYLDECNAIEVNSAIDRYIDTNDDFDQIERTVAQFIRACQHGLDKTNTIKTKVPYVSLLIEENSRLKQLLSNTTIIYKAFVAEYRESQQLDKSQMDELIENLMEYKKIKPHYSKIQNSFFPALERYGENMNCLKLMWHIQDGVMSDLKDLVTIINTLPFDFDKLNRVYGDMFLKIGALIYREENILFPLAVSIIPEEVFDNLLADVEDLGTAFKVNLSDFYRGKNMSESLNNSSQNKEEVDKIINTHSNLINLSVGELTASQINLMLTNLPVDITFVDENDNVRYFSQGKERIFPRSPEIIGRAVQNCHPPKSVHIVQKILQDFKNGKREVAEFWIQMNGMFIHIRYFPLFEGDTYKGVIEVSQEISGIRSLEGEKRLLDEE